VSVVCCQRPLRRADHSSKRVLPSVSACNREALIMSWPWSIGGLLLHGEKLLGKYAVLEVIYKTPFLITVDNYP
jgi:hypothetical protein